MQKHQASPFYKWIILVSCCALNGASLGTIINCKGLFITPVSAELGCSVSAFTLYISFYGVSAAVTLLAVDRVLDRFPLRVILTGALAVLCLATGSMGAFHRLSSWYLAGIAQGVSGAFLLYVPVPMMINNWFTVHKGMALGIAATASGVLGAVMNPILSAVIASAGWRNAYFVQGVSSFLLAAPFTAFFVAKHPPSHEPPEVSRSRSPRSAPIRPAGEYGQKFWLCMIFTVIVTFCAAYAQHFSHYAAGLGMSAQIGAWMVSVSMLGNILGKTFFGMGADRWGGRRACVLSLSLVLGGFLLLIAGNLGQAGMLAGAFFTGIDHANLSVMVPLAVAAIAPGEEFEHIFSRTTIGTMLASAFSTTLIGTLFDLFASYQAAFFLGAFLQVLAILLILRLFPSPAKAQASKGKTSG